jgi:transposase
MCPTAYCLARRIRRGLGDGEPDGADAGRAGAARAGGAADQRCPGQERARPPEDKLDAIWLARLTEQGLLRASFVPPKAIRDLSDRTWARTRLVQERTRCWQRPGKLLEGAGQSVIGGQHADYRLRAGHDQGDDRGERHAQVLAGLARGPIKAKRNDLAAALDGVFDDHHGELAQIAAGTDRLPRRQDHPDHHPDRCISRGDPRRLGPAADGTTGPPRYRPGRRRAARGGPAGRDPRHQPAAGPHYHRRVRPGYDPVPTTAHLVSWAGLCPSAGQSGPRTRADKKGQGDPWLRGAPGQAAVGAGSTQTFLGESYGRIARRRGPAKVHAATARSILVIILHLLADPAARYIDLGPGYHAARIDTDRKIRNHIQQIQALGFDVTIIKPP